MTFDNQMKLPGSYFAAMAKRDYRNWSESLIRELTQNSVDAGSKRLDINWNEETRILIFKDNGSGMTRNILENAFLQFGASHKSEGAVGGMGKAKELIIASHPGWSIKTNGILATGRHNEYNVTECEFEQGTTITLNLTPDMYMDWDTISGFFAKCQISADVYINGDIYRQSNRKLAKVSEIEGFGKLYKADNYNNCYVRANGVFMFREYVESNGFIFEISNSAGCMTAGRDGFSNDFYHKFAALVRQMNFNGSSLKEYKAEIDFMVAENAEEVEVVENNIDFSPVAMSKDVNVDFIGAMDFAIKSNQSITKYVPKVSMTVGGMSSEEMESERGQEILQGLRRKAKLSDADLFAEKTRFYSKLLHGRFLFRTTDLTKSSQKYMITVRSAMINFLIFGVTKEVSKIMAGKIESPKNFIVGGFIDKDSDQEAFCQNDKILFNLEKISENNFDEKLLVKIISLACHEVIHFREQHNERMCGLLTDFLPLLVTEHYPRFREIFKKVKQMKPVFKAVIEDIDLRFPEEKRVYRSKKYYPSEADERMQARWQGMIDKLPS